MFNRYRRLRKTKNIRNLVCETILTPHDLIQPFFVIEGKNKKETVEAMPGVYRCSQDLLLKEVESLLRNGGQAVLLFGLPKKKDAAASEAYKKEAIVPQAIKTLRKEFPQLVIFTDVCLCAYIDHGHCGVVEDNRIDNDKTLELLSKMAVSHADAGADFVAPSDMMDFRVARIREDLDREGFKDTGILSYAVKYSSAFYGPFREAADSAPSFGDRQTYQMDKSNAREALKESRQDVTEGADMIMVKPALAYLDIVSMLKRELTVPIVAYNVSGEYSMIKAAAEKGWINEKEVVLESLTSMKRAGADIVISYFVQDVLSWIKEDR